MERAISLSYSQEPTMFLILSQMYPDHTLPTYYPKTHSNIIFPSMLGLPRALPFRFSNQYIVSISHLSHWCQMPCSSHPPWFDDPDNI